MHCTELLNVGFVVFSGGDKTNSGEEDDGIDLMSKMNLTVPEEVPMIECACSPPARCDRQMDYCLTSSVVSSPSLCSARLPSMTRLLYYHVTN